MINVFFIRHGQTQWNVDKQIQGHTDIPLNATGKKQISSVSIPTALTAVQWFTSPLQRATETAKLLHLSAEKAPALIEMNWGDWEGKKIAQLREELGEAFLQNEQRGLDLLPTHGESPRQVGHRLTEWVATLSQETGTQYGAVCHKGVIRAVYALASGWDMKAKLRTNLILTVFSTFNSLMGTGQLSNLICRS